MYPLAPFQSTDRAKLHAVMRAFPLATLISAGAPWPAVTQVPLVLDDARGPHGVLLGHFDGNNPHGAALRADPRVYALFHGPNHYISPSIYPTEQYPGWNYVTVHVHALAHPLTDRERVADILFRLAELHEPKDSGYRLTREQRNFERFLDMVFGFELEIASMRAIFKLAQDKGDAQAQIAADHLAEVTQTDLRPLLTALLAPEKT
ncbi:FMN-binding negative transcriptional regulator [Nannocystis sp. ILAH1]|uniref:FMN-binding negative transcriptional regulator n=1 Tax=unclassified Nannocystis TaxID=2627009 RepID=UPI00226E627D|nr:MULTISPECIES: FMN-binding negative transcriptional regulator [unclassified Nannocystis]MCY0989888.1 FMN-binding negative transcriptional regulator [Nannocystis sp. ILAH1]MCY1071076.1 FMN-binding negative transcriptional regulator [Nannocystis sp. RBIL2]